MTKTFTLLNRQKTIYLIGISVFFSSISFASDLTIPNNFVANSPAVAAQVNENFSAIEVSVDDNNTRLVALESMLESLQMTVATLQTENNNQQTSLINQQTQITNLQTENSNQQTQITNLQTTNSDQQIQITNLQTTNSDQQGQITGLQTSNTSLLSEVSQLQSDLAVVENNTVLELDGFLKLSTINNYDTAEFTSVNVQVNSGSGGTGNVINGLGNLTVGYNEAIDIAPEFCSDSQFDNQIDCENASEIWANNVRRGSHNLIVGFGNSYDNYGSFLAGSRNVANGDLVSVSGGLSNIATGIFSSISGGVRNTTGRWSSICGGENNIASGDYSSVSGGRNNVASGNFSSVSGGNNRMAPGSDDWAAGDLFENF
ncbi:MAG: hypothetical protein AB8B80_16065 [Marinicellaceae bacterium]